MTKGLQIKLGERRAWLDDVLLDLTSNEFEALLLLAKSRKAADTTNNFIKPEQLAAVMSPGADVECVMEALTVKLQRARS
jgi:hypothetical protein